MRDGRIEIQGLIADLRGQGILQRMELQLRNDRKDETNTRPHNPSESLPKDSKAPRKLVEEEERARGSVKWPIYEKYIKASYVSFR